MEQQMMMMQQQMIALGKVVDESRGGNEITAGLVNQFGMQDIPIVGGDVDSSKPASADALGGDSQSEGEPTNTKKARQRVADSTSPT